MGWEHVHSLLLCSFVRSVAAGITTVSNFESVTVSPFNNNLPSTGKSSYEKKSWTNADFPDGDLAT